MVIPAAVGTFVCHLLLCLVLVEALLCVVLSAANSTRRGVGTVGLVMAKTLAAETSQWLGCVRPQVEYPPVPQIEMGREGASDSDDDLSCFLPGAGGDAACGLLHLRVSL